MTNIFPILSLQTTMYVESIYLTVCHDTKTEQNPPSLFYYLLSTFIDFFFYNNVLLHIELSAFIDFNCKLFYHWSINFITTIRLMSLLKKFV